VPGQDQPQPSPSDHGGEGVRVTAKTKASRWTGLLYQLLAVAVVTAAAAYLINTPAPGGRTDEPAPSAAESASTQPPDRVATRSPSARVDAARTLRRFATPAFDPPEEPYDLPSLDPDDVAAHIHPDDPEPTVAELIEALHHVGIHSGIGAFNPPGTSPPLEGLAVPEDFDLPEGFMRHYQVTDEGEPIEAILMFSPDYEFYDGDGNPITVPEDRVVPPELAPPELPIRRVVPPTP
jgi:hypothetical protein